MRTQTTGVKSDVLIPEQVSFTAMHAGTQADYDLLTRHEDRFASELPVRILNAVRNLEHSVQGFQIDRLRHSLQSATRAHRDGRDEEYVVSALIHDLGDELAPFAHGELVSAIMGPFFSAKLCWTWGIIPPFSNTTSVGTPAMILTPGSSGETTNGSQIAWNFASDTTRTVSIPPTTICRSTSSNRWCTAYSASPVT
jgi:hypothetical protein